MRVSFLGSQPVKHVGKTWNGVAKRPWLFFRAAISIVVGVTVLVLASEEISAWFGTGKWPGYRLLGLAEHLAGGPVLSGSSWGPWFFWAQQVIRGLLELVPASLAGLVVGAWVAWKVFPRVDHARSLSAGLRDADWIEAKIRRTSGESLAIVSRQRPRLFAYLNEAFRDSQKVRVIVDRRWGNRRNRRESRELERRRQDRRRRPDSTEAQPGPLDVIVAPRVPSPDGQQEQSGERHEETV